DSLLLMEIINHIVNQVPQSTAGRYIRGRICRDGACTVSTGHEIEPLHAIYFACLTLSQK
ncbi:MAG: hypothetical protein LBS55_09015, partial [Prevotellaceae bacterium]|nr:hypothetical protein [Prevotellaceae bacterium]